MSKKKIYFISDYFVDEVLGGGELNDDQLITILGDLGYDINPVKSSALTIDSIEDQENAFYIISNFCHMSLAVREKLTYECEYVIYEHDHKYLSTRNPVHFKDFCAPAASLRNYFFYKNAKKVFCQTSFHRDILLKNLDIDNVISVGGNLWSTGVLTKLRELSKRQKQEKVSILDSHIDHKNTLKTVQYCKQNSIDYDLVKDNNYEAFLDKLGKNKKLVFFPKSPETLSRVVCEARMMGMGVILNQMVGASHEPWFELKGEELIDYMVEKRQEISKLIVSAIETGPVKRTDKLISIVATFHKAEEFIESYMENITSQTIFDKCELILVDSASPGKERDIIEEYASRHDNIRYYRYDEKFPPTEGHNIAIKKSNCKFVVWAMLDDKKSLDGLETLYNAIKDDNSIELVYGDCLVTSDKNETVENTKSTTLSEHSIRHFSRENMIKCLPGPMPMWRKRLHEGCGFFDQDNRDYADDWDMWLRAVHSGCVFKKVDKTVGLYLEGGRSQLENNLDQKREEAALFFKYKDMFGVNSQRYHNYFKQFV